MKPKPSSPWTEQRKQELVNLNTDIDVEWGGSQGFHNRFLDQRIALTTVLAVTPKHEAIRLSG